MVPGFVLCTSRNIVAFRYADPACITIGLRRPRTYQEHSRASEGLACRLPSSAYPESRAGSVHSHASVGTTIPSASPVNAFHVFAGPGLIPASSGTGDPGEVVAILRATCRHVPSVLKGFRPTPRVLPRRLRSHEVQRTYRLLPGTTMIHTFSFPAMDVENFSRIGRDRTCDLMDISHRLLPLSYYPVGREGVEPSLVRGLSSLCLPVAPPAHCGRVRSRTLNVTVVVLVFKTSCHPRSEPFQAETRGHDPHTVARTNSLANCPSPRLVDSPLWDEVGSNNRARDLQSRPAPCDHPVCAP